MVPVTVAAETGSSLELRFTHMSALHRRFFSDPELVMPLAAGVSACATGTVPVVVTYDEGTRKGYVVLDLSREALTCLPRQEGGHVDLAALAPLTRAVATYRNEVAGAKDIRVYGFDAGIFVRDGQGWVSLWAHGQEPADGSTFHPCVGLDGLKRCTAAVGHEGVTRFALSKHWLDRRLVSALTPGAAPVEEPREATPTPAAAE
jgi:hypothetical protein